MIYELHSAGHNSSHTSSFNFINYIGSLLILTHGFGQGRTFFTRKIRARWGADLPRFASSCLLVGSRGKRGWRFRGSAFNVTSEPSELWRSHVLLAFATIMMCRPLRLGTILRSDQFDESNQLPDTQAHWCRWRTSHCMTPS